MSTTTTATPLTVSDRCDRCGVQAFMRVHLESGSALLFCAHHFREHEVRLRAVAQNVDDASNTIS